MTYADFFRELQIGEQIQIIVGDGSLGPRLFRPMCQTTCDAPWVLQRGIGMNWEIVIPAIQIMTGLIGDLLSFVGLRLAYVEVRDKENARLELVSRMPMQYPAHGVTEVQNQTAREYQLEAMRTAFVVFKVERSQS